MALCYRAMLVFYRREITVIRSPLLIAVSTHVRKAADDMNILRAVSHDRSFNPRRRAAAKFLIFA